MSMKSTGIIRRVDELGRIVIPKEMRTKMGIAEDTPMEIYVEGDSIVMRRDISGCIFCGKTENTSDIRGKQVCRECISYIKES